MTLYYSVFGLTIQSTIPLVAFRPIEGKGSIDVIVKEGRVSRPEENLSDTVYGKFLVYHPTFCYQAIADNKGAFLVEKKENRTEVILDFKFPAEQQTLLAYLYGTGLSAILQMQAQFAIHASGVVVDGSLCLFCGQSGIGKSTLAASLKSRGYPLYTDDKCLLYKEEASQQWMAHPSLQIMRLWEDATAAVRTDSFLANPVPVISRIEKHQYEIKATEQITAPVPLKTIYILSKVEDLDAPTCQLLEGVEKMTYLQAQIFRRFMVKGFQQEAALWNFISRVAMDIPVYLLKRPVLVPIAAMGDFVEGVIGGRNCQEEKRSSELAD